MTAARRRLIAAELCDRFRVSQRRVSRALDLARSGLRYAPVVGDERSALARRIEALSGIHPRFGYRRIWVYGARPSLRRPEAELRAESAALLRRYTPVRQRQFHGILVTLWQRR